MQTCLVCLRLKRDPHKSENSSARLSRAVSFDADASKRVLLQRPPRCLSMRPHQEFDRLAEREPFHWLDERDPLTPVSSSTKRAGSTLVSRSRNAASGPLDLWASLSDCRCGIHNEHEIFSFDGARGKCEIARAPSVVNENELAS
jgi:hypothetical protein